ncbi:MAG: DUF2304 domain-containing protein [Alphaproteobacteria bacterium]
MPNIAPSLQTIALISLFAALYLYWVFRKTIAMKLDLYDLIMLSMVAIVPLVFVTFPAIAMSVSSFTGVVFPFVVMFGGLFLVLFVFMHRMTARLHKIERQNCALVQEVGLLHLELDEVRRKRQVAA